MLEVNNNLAVEGYDSASQQTERRFCNREAKLKMVYESLLIFIMGTALQNLNPAINNAVDKAVGIINPAAPVALHITL